MKLSQKGYELITSFEGIKNDAYQDSIGIWTCGVGFTHINGVPVKKGDHLTNGQIQEQFIIQIKSYEDAVNNSVKSSINQNMYDSLVSFTFNVGVGNFKSSTLLKKVNINPNDLTIADEFQKWDKAAGKVIQGLLNRRIKEAHYYFASVN